MSGVLIHDGRRSGHHSWAVDIIGAGGASGAVVNPFMTPRFAIPRYIAGGDFATRIASAGGEVIFDATTHGRMLPGSNRTDLYDTWELWGSAGVGLDTILQRQQHVERVFARQSELGAPHLAPTIGLDSPVSPDAYAAQELRFAAAGVDPSSWQSLAGSRTFWRSATALDAYVGELAELRAPTWVLTVTNEMVVDQSPDLSDLDAFAGLLRTIHSLSERSRVVLTYADFSGLPAIAAGADSIGAGWDRGMRTFDPLSFHISSDPGIRIPASYVTQRGLVAVLKRDAALAIERWNPTEAVRIRGGAMPANERAERFHHLSSLNGLVLDVDGSSNRSDRVARLRELYADAAVDFDTLIAALRPAVREPDKATWIQRPSALLEMYAASEGL